eukprot:CAMPEP_0196727418 /NCGR_PEP_ID=MMETSP1091-20130531/8401_1 /TAXON_ID=302021 /ORGANISM="Rhodomonas sp., Strain CCMP768" /LENGTH=51 /DNA_ID=CAMNT_0042070001 /DNA_START=5 /DNA_END=160 /DNA_ORIENTATION=+
MTFQIEETVPSRIFGLLAIVLHVLHPSPPLTPSTRLTLFRACHGTLDALPS